MDQFKISGAFYFLHILTFQPFLLSGLVKGYKLLPSLPVVAATGVTVPHLPSLSILSILLPRSQLLLPQQVASFLLGGESIRVTVTVPPCLCMCRHVTVICNHSSSSIPTVIH